MKKTLMLVAFVAAFAAVLVELRGKFVGPDPVGGVVFTRQCGG